MIALLEQDAAAAAFCPRAAVASLQLNVLLDSGAAFGLGEFRLQTSLPFLILVYVCVPRLPIVDR